MNTIHKLCGIMLACAMIAGCNNYTAPGRTSKSVSPDKLVGQWRMMAASGYLGLLQLSADGSCTYRATESSDPVHGTWSLNTADFQATCGTLNVAGWLIDDSSAPSGVSIYGGDDDPDDYAVWAFIG